MNLDNCQDLIYEESKRHGDIVQGDFFDSYFNNTLKMMMAFDWLSKFCPQSKYAFFVDDDFYVSLKNLVSYANSPLTHSSNVMPDGYLPQDGRLFVGFVVRGRHPQRLYTNKWYMSLQEYPFNRYPDFVEAGAFLLSNRAVKEIAAAVPFVKPFPFDDNYLGIVCKKIGLKLVHNGKFVNDHMSYAPSDFSNVIAFHGQGDHDFAFNIWKEQILLENA
jgi:hypothetical protein